MIILLYYRSSKRPYSLKELVLLERIISCKYEVLAKFRHISTVWAVSSLLPGLNQH